MKVIRPIKQTDTDSLFALSKQMGTGMTSMPPDREVMAKRCSSADMAFTANPDGYEYLSYLFGLEDSETGQLIGTTGIKTGIGLERPFYSYRLLRLTQVSNDPKLRVETEIMQLCNDFTGATEVGSLFLSKDYREPGVGSLLAKMRYMFMAAFADRFDDRIVAEIRGWVDGDGQSPFWDAIGRHFFNMDFKAADEINGRGNSQFIADMMPKSPIYRALLPQSAQGVIAKPHDSAVPAVELLKREGFRFSGAIDIFDGGPSYVADRGQLLTGQLTRKSELAGTIEGVNKKAEFLVARADLTDFRVVAASLAETDSGVWVADEVARALDLVVGDPLYFAPLKPSRETKN